jgi:hypothetical protein
MWNDEKDILNWGREFFLELIKIEKLKSKRRYVRKVYMICVIV